MQIAKVEQFSDHVYAYDLVSHETYRADKETERQVAKETAKVDITDMQSDIKKSTVLGKLAESKEKEAAMEKAAPAGYVGLKIDDASLV